jgi:Fe-S-cluster containining protein
VLNPSAPIYKELLERLDEWFQAARDRHPNVIPCRSGCTACCYGPFDINSADVLLLREGIESLSDEIRRDVTDRARVLLDLMQQLEPGWGGDYDIQAIGDDRFDALAEQLAGEPCPLLGDDGACSVYAHRPMVCRMIGLPMDAGAGRVIENECPIQDRFPGYPSLPAAPFNLDAFETIEAACLEAASVQLFGTPARAGYETTLAAAIVRFSPPPPPTGRR